MQRVIELARISRERRSIGLKTPLKTLVVIHHDSQYLDDVRSLENYITEELNIRDLVLSGDEASYNVQLSVTADWPVLGKKLRKDMARVKKALPSLTSEQVHEYLQNKEILVDGIRLEEGDLVVRRGLREDATSKNLEINSDSEVLTILDSEIHPELAQEGLAREIINRVQRLRKKAGLQATDDVKMEYQVLSDPEDVGLAQAFISQSGTFEKTLRRPLEKVQELGNPSTIISEEKQEVQQATALAQYLRDCGQHDSIAICAVWTK
jgi:isoleucyl-tRNA synthetase